MVKQDRYYGVDRYLPHAVLATTAVVAIPLMVVVGLLIALEGELAPLLAGVVGFVLALIVAGIGSVLWAHSSGALDMAFSELLIWGWLRRKRAEERASRDARLLGLDSDGRPSRPARSARAQQLAILGDLSSALESKDPYTHGHSQRVERHVMLTASQLGLSLEETSELRRAAALHDVGKIRVPHRILRKPSSLTVEERRIIEQHSSVGAWLVSNVCRKDVVDAVRHHHERWDGRGYPDGLAGDTIPLFARIIAVADAFDAMTSTRPYRVAYDSRTAIDILEAEAGAQFDPQVVRAFITAVPDQVPIAAFLPFFGASLLRKLGGSVRRVLNGTTASGLAAGAATLLVASLMSPVPTPLAGPDPGRGSTPAPIAGPATPFEAEPVTAKQDDEKKTRAGGGKKAKPRATKERSRADVGAPAPKKKGTVVLSDEVDREKNEEAAPGLGPDPAPDPPERIPRPPKPGDDDDSDNDDSDDDDQDDDDTDDVGEDKAKGPNPPTDPQPEKGADCPGKQESRGNELHCG